MAPVPSSSRTAVVLASDERFLGPLSCVLSMLVATATTTPVVVLHDGVPVALRDVVARSVAGALDLRWIDIVNDMGDDLHTPPHFSRVSYARLLMADALGDVDRAVWLDGDILVRRSPDPLLSIDLGDGVAGACADLNAPRAADELAIWQTEGFRPDDVYFNAGVLVADLARWRAEGLGAQLLDFARRRSSDLRWADQDVLNTVLRGRITRLHPTWNFLWGGYGRRPSRWRSEGVLGPGEWDAARRDPAIVHFAGSVKPWHPRYGGALSSAWYAAWRAHAAASPFASTLLDDAAGSVRRAVWSLATHPLDGALRARRRVVARRG